MWKISLFCFSLSHTVRHLHEGWRLILFGSIALYIEVCSFPSFHRTRETYLLPKDMIRTTRDIFMLSLCLQSERGDWRRWIHVASNQSPLQKENISGDRFLCKRWKSYQGTERNSIFLFLTMIMMLKRLCIQIPLKRSQQEKLWRQRILQRWSRLGNVYRSFIRSFPSTSLSTGGRKGIKQDKS